MNEYVFFIVPAGGMTWKIYVGHWTGNPTLLLKNIDSLGIAIKVSKLIAKEEKRKNFFVRVTREEYLFGYKKPWWKFWVSNKEIGECDDEIKKWMGRLK